MILISVKDCCCNCDTSSDILTREWGKRPCNDGHIIFLLLGVLYTTSLSPCIRCASRSIPFLFAAFIEWVTIIFLMCYFRSIELIALLQRANSPPLKGIACLFMGIALQLCCMYWTYQCYWIKEISKKFINIIIYVK